jgi:hypothetical protein
MSNGTSYSYHYGSKMDLETMKVVTAKIERIVTIAGYGTEIKEVTTHLNKEKKVIDKVGTRPYTVEVQATNTSQPTVSPTDVEGNPYAEWKYIDPSLVTVSSEEDEKVIDV